MYPFDFVVHINLGLGSDRLHTVSWEQLSDGVFRQSLRVHDLLNAVVSGPRYFPHDLVDVVHCDSEQSGGQTIASASVLDKENHLINGARYRLIYRMCPGCPFCPLPCTRLEPHIMCAHSERSDPLSHLWYSLPRGQKQRRMDSSTFGRLTMRDPTRAVQGHRNFRGIRLAVRIFGTELVEDDLKEWRRLISHQRWVEMMWC